MLRIRTKYWLIIPAVVLMLVVLIFPLIYSFRTGLYYYVLTKPTYRPYIGVDNFSEVIHDDELHNAVKVTLRFSAWAVTIELVLGYAIARSLSIIPYFRNVFMSVLMVPMMITPIAVGLLWRMLLHPDLGIVNYLLDEVGIGGQPWLALKSTALPTLIFIDAWQWTPFVMLLLYAGILSLPEEPFEAATIDGANFLQKVWYIELPMLRSVLVVALILRIIDLLRTYDLIYILTGGGPGSSTETFSYYVYRLAFVKLNMGEASAASYLFLFAIVIVTSILYPRLRSAASQE
jgi:multiple sugar transport system permease protein